MSERFLQDRVELLCGDCREQIATLEDDSIDACVTDPPYALVSIGDRFSKPNSKPPNSKDNPHQQYNRLSRGFMGKQWDTGEVAFDPAFWAEVLRVLKPGGHVLAMGGTRTYHRLACAIEDAGFEIRDCVMWVYGAGFPKSHDVSKGIDKRPGVTRHTEFAAELRAAMKAKGFTNTFDVAEIVIGRRTGAVANWQKYQWPQAKWWPALRDLLGMNGAKWDSIIAEADRETIDTQNGTNLVVAPGQDNDRSTIELDITAPATDAARQWAGWGTALKPSWEPCVLARKPLIGTVAANVLEHGTGAINVDGCRVATDELTPRNNNNTSTLLQKGFEGAPKTIEPSPLGRWPANLIHDGSAEVLEAFPESVAGVDKGERGTGGIWSASSGVPCGPQYGDSGSAARFFKQCKLTEDDLQWARNQHGDISIQDRTGTPIIESGDAKRLWYTSKADSDDRIGSKHPTVKPLDLMQYLCRLITPPGGTVLDPFAGTGTTGEAAFREGFRAVLIEREEEYQADIRRRMALVMAGPDERSRESMKEKQKGKPIDYGPLFGGTDELPEDAE